MKMMRSGEVGDLPGRGGGAGGGWGLGAGLQELFVSKGFVGFAGRGSLIIKFSEPVFAREALSQVLFGLFASLRLSASGRGVKAPVVWSGSALSLGSDAGDSDLCICQMQDCGCRRAGLGAEALARYACRRESNQA